MNPQNIMMLMHLPFISGFFLPLSSFIGINYSYLFYWIAMFNLFSLVLFTYSWMGFIEITLSLALLFVPMSWYLKSLSDLSPSNSPIFLLPLLNLIELISTGITLITISARLAANMSAGHILMSIISPLLFLEVMVSVIQGYVFSMLSTLYLS